MNESEKKYLLELGRNTIAAKLDGRAHEVESPDSDELNSPCGAFVTIKCGGKLRGCIGNIRASKPLYETVREMAEAAATQDPRFPSMRRNELDGAHIEISVLSPFEKVSSPDEIEVGRDGLYITKGMRSGLLLPQVATEWGWDRNTFLSQTCYKAGLPLDAWKHPDTEIFRFTAEVFGEEEA